MAEYELEINPLNNFVTDVNPFEQIRYSLILAKQKCYLFDIQKSSKL